MLQQVLININFYSFWPAHFLYEYPYQKQQWAVLVVQVVTLLCKRRIIAFDPYLNSWKGFKTGLEEMWLLLKASLRTKGWIHLMYKFVTSHNLKFVTSHNFVIVICHDWKCHFYVESHGYCQRSEVRKIGFVNFVSKLRWMEWKYLVPIISKNKIH